MCSSGRSDRRSRAPKPGRSTFYRGLQRLKPREDGRIFPPEPGGPGEFVDRGRLFKSSKGIATCQRILQAAGKSGCVPILVVAEKRYCIAAKIVDTFFDPYFNKHAEWLPLLANINRTEVANYLYEYLPDQTLRQFALAYMKPTLQGFANIIHSLVIQLELLGERRLAMTIRGNLDCLEDLVSTEAATFWPISHGVLTALNVPVFYSFVAVADNLAGLRPPSELEVIHDTAFEFEPIYRMLFSGFVAPKIKPSPLYFQDGRAAIMGFSHFKGFKFGESIAVPQLQAADVLAASTRVVFERALRKDIKGLEKVASMIVPAFIIPDGPRFAFSLFSERLAGSLAAYLPSLRAA